MAKYEIELMVNVAQMYYNNGLKQEEIAKRVNVSRSSISLILSEAREQGVVEINVRDPRKNNSIIADKFEQRFNLKKCIIVPTSIKERDMLLHMVARRAVDVFNQELSKGATVGIAWGETCQKFMDEYNSNDEEFDNLRVVPLIGSSNRSLERYQMNEVVRQFALKLNGTPHFIHAPAFPLDIRDFELYAGSSSMQMIQRLWDEVDIALISIGAPPQEYRDGIAEIIERGEDRAAQIRDKAVGDLCARFFDQEGSFIRDDIFASTIAIPVESLEKVKTCIGVVSGIEKASSIIGGLRTGLIDVLVTDQYTAEQVLKLLE